MRKALFVAVAAVALACGEDGPTGPAVANRFELVRLNGFPLPYVREETPTGREEVTSGEILLKVDGSFTDKTRFRSIQGNVSSTFSTILEGPFVREGSTITFTVLSEDDPSGDDQYSGTFIAGDTLMIQAGATVWKYVER
jgi:hypothetical protein